LFDKTGLRGDTDDVLLQTATPSKKPTTAIGALLQEQDNANGFQGIFDFGKAGAASGTPDVLSFDQSDQKSVTSSQRQQYLPRMTAGFGTLEEMVRSSMKQQQAPTINQNEVSGNRISFNPDWQSPSLRLAS
jgi:hypothetical protein